VYKRDYAFRMNVMEEIRSCIEILAHDIKVDTTMFIALQGLSDRENGDSVSQRISQQQRNSNKNAS